DVSERKTADEDRRELRAAEATAKAGALDRLRKTDFLAKSAGMLASSRNAEETIGEVSTLAVHEVADWFIVDRLEEDGALTRIAAERAEASATPEPQIDVREAISQRQPRLTPSEIVVPLVSHG